MRRPETTLAIAARLTTALRITRLFDVTEADTLGVPIWFCERPTGAVCVLHAGKGVEPIDAQVGAVMEAIEFAVAEWDAATAVGEILSLDDVIRQFSPPLQVADFAPILGAPITLDRLLLTDVCEDVRTGRRYQLPSELVRVPAPTPDDGVWLFRWSSNGLASGNSLEEATLHALLEVLERDCIAMDLVDRSPQWLDLGSLPQPLDQWAAHWANVGIELHVRHLRNEFGLACFEACISEPGALPPRTAFGWGLHPDSRLAVTRAITEAAQTRLHALRHPLMWAGPVAASRRDSNRNIRAGQSILLSDVPHSPCSDIGDTLNGLLERLRNVGLPFVLRRRMDGRAGGPELEGLSVVKVIVPGCESAIGSDMRIGRRLADRLVAAA